MKADAEITERKLIRAARDNRDQDAWNELKRRYWKRVRAQVVNRLQNDDVLQRMHDDGYMADAITRRTFRNAWKKNNLDKFSYPYSFLGWVRRIATNLCTDERRRQERIRAKLEKAIGEKELNLPLYAVSAEEQAEMRAQERRSEERDAAIRECLGTISADRREVIVLHRYEKMKYRQISDLLGIPMGTVKSRISRGKDELGRCLRSRYPDLFGR